MKVKSICKEYLTEELYFVVGEKIEGKAITKIEYHEPQGEGDAHYCDIYYEDETMKRIFRPDEIDFDCSDKDEVKDSNPFLDLPF